MHVLGSIGINYTNGIPAYGLNVPPPDLTVPGVPDDPASMAPPCVSDFRRGFAGWACPGLRPHRERIAGNSVRRTR